MKIRNGFISNSSSSSFVCGVCGNEQSGMNLPLNDCDMSECENGHTFCNEHIEGGENIQEAIVNAKLADTNLSSEERAIYERIKENEDYGVEYYDVPADVCPICNFKVVLDEDLVAYLIKTTGIARTEVFEKVKQENKRRKKLRSSDYISYACGRLNTTQAQLVKEIFLKFSNYEEFYNYLNGKE